MSEDNGGTLYCANHPSVETLLRCNRCAKPICSRCAIRTPVGYRCAECVRGQQRAFYTATSGHQIAGSVVALLLGLVLGAAAYFAAQLSWLSTFLAPVIGGLVGEAIFRASARRRARRFPWVGSALVGAGALLTFAVLQLLLRFGGLWTLLWGGIFIALAVGTVFARLR